MSWRYQPVWQDFGETRLYSLCEVYLDENGRLNQWTLRPAMEPVSESIEGLRETVAHMQRDAQWWKPVAFETLEVGMTFERIEEGATEPERGAEADAGHQ